MLLTIFSLRITHKNGIDVLLKPLDYTNFAEFINSPNLSIVFFDESTKDLDFPFYGLNMYRKNIKFGIAPRNYSYSYHCGIFPCIVPFKNGQRIVTDRAPQTPTAFSNWIRVLKDGKEHNVQTTEDLRTIFDGTHSSVFCIDDKRPESYPNHMPIYYSTSSIFKYFNITVAKGLYCYNPIFRTLDKIDDAKSCMKESVIHPKGVRLTERKFLAGYFTNPFNSTYDETIYKLIKGFAKDSRYKDFWFTAVAKDKSTQYLSDAGRFSKGVPPFFFVLNTSNLNYVRERWCLTKREQMFDKSFIEDFLVRISNGSEPYSLMSEPIPEKDPYMPNLVRAVADNLEEIVLENGTDVLLTVTASWCGHCHNFIPTMNQMANIVEDRAKIVYINADSNELPDFVPPFSGYPSIFFFPAYNKTAIPYNGNRDIDSLLTFLGKNVKDPFDPENIGNGSDDNDDFYDDNDDL